MRIRDKIDLSWSLADLDLPQILNRSLIVSFGLVLLSVILKGQFFFVFFAAITCALAAVFCISFIVKHKKFFFFTTLLFYSVKLCLWVYHGI